MIGLRPDLLEHCRRVLVQCSQLDGQASLRAVFVTTELARYRSGLPDADNKPKRVGRVIDYLLPKWLIDGRSAFLLFLEELRNHQDEEELRNQLTDLCSDIGQALSNEFLIPFVTVAMTHDEAIALVDETAFDGLAVAPIERTRFQEFKDNLQGHTIGQLLDRYGDEREDWKPYAHDGDTIEKIVLEMTGHINQGREGYPPIHPHFFSADFFAEDDDSRLQTWDQLSWSGCVLIVDAISLFHPTVYRRLLQSEMGANRQVAIAIVLISSLISSGNQASQLIKREVKSRMQRAFVRSAWYVDLLCNHEIENMHSLLRWFDTALPQAIRIVHEQRSRKRPHPTGLKMMRVTIVAPEVDTLIFGKVKGR